MNEYIEREAAVEVTKYYAYMAIDKKQMMLDTVDDVLNIVARIEKLPAADVVPVMHGQWVNFYGDYRTAECSVCANLYEMTFDGESNGALFDGFKRLYKYCPNCGARMDGCAAGK